MGGRGADRIYLGNGRNAVCYETLAASGVGPTNQDMIESFSRGNKIDLQMLDASSNLVSDQGSRIVGKFTGATGEIMLTNASEGHTYIRVSADENAAVDIIVAIITFRISSN